MSETKRISVPERPAWILRTLQEAGYEAYVVGGCVRDSILGRTPQDWDITTSARPEQVKALFRRTVDTGLQHGTVTVLIKDEGFEVTTYRIDGDYEDGRHPKAVTFTPNLEEDLLRRDFTINAMAYNETRGLVDLYGGLEDIESKTIRCVGTAKERFGEDALRMLRAVRFSAQLGYEIEPDTMAAIKELAPTIAKISEERIQTELVKLVSSDHPDYLRKAWESGLTKIFLPEFDEAMATVQNNPHHCYTVGEHLLSAMTNIRADKELRLTMMLHDIGKPQTRTTDEKGVDHFHGHIEASAELAKKILRRLKFDNHTIDVVCHLVRYHDYGYHFSPTDAQIRKAINKIGKDLFPLYLEVRRADTLAQSDYYRKEKLENLQLWEDGFRRALEAGECVTLKELAVTGKDLIDSGMKPGPRLGQILSALLEEVLENPARNERDTLLRRAAELMKE
jgi:tRNA nucleotidyltransferase (CCA-adding enzyme)